LPLLAALWIRRWKPVLWVLGREDLRDLELYASADLIVSTGGTYLVENYNLKARILDYQVARALGRNCVFFTQSLGPFRSGAVRSALHDVLRDAPLVLLRDEASLRHLRDLGLTGSNAVLRPDAAFALADVPAIRDAIVAGWKRTARMRVVVSVRGWRHFAASDAEAGMKRVEAAIAALCAHMVSRYDADVVFMSTCQGIPEYTWDDSAVALRIAATLPEEARRRVRVDRERHDPRALIAELGKADVVVAMRMHMAILALCAGRPVLPIAYEFKTMELFDGFGLARHVQDIDSMDSESACAALDRFVAEIPGIHGDLLSAVLQARVGALSTADLLPQAVAVLERSRLPGKVPCPS
jgi:colanic acid/amylovoran biosynthesis protein